MTCAAASLPEETIEAPALGQKGELPVELGQWAADRASRAEAAGRVAEPWENSARDFAAEMGEELADALNYGTWGLMQADQAGAGPAESRLWSLALASVAQAYNYLKEAQAARTERGGE